MLTKIMPKVMGGPRGPKNGCRTPFKRGRWPAASSRTRGMASGEARPRPTEKGVRVPPPRRISPAGSRDGVRRRANGIYKLVREMV